MTFDLATLIAAQRKQRAAIRSELLDAAFDAALVNKTDPQTADRWRRAHLYPDT